VVRGRVDLVLGRVEVGVLVAAAPMRGVCLVACCRMVRTRCLCRWLGSAGCLTRSVGGGRSLGRHVFWNMLDVCTPGGRHLFFIFSCMASMPASVLWNLDCELPTFLSCHGPHEMSIVFDQMSCCVSYDLCIHIYNIFSGHLMMQPTSSYATHSIL